MTKIVGNSGLIDTWAATGTKTEPNDTKKDLGWTEGERPAFDFMNFLQAQFGEKINHIMANGMPAWNATDTYAANVFVSRAGVIYRSLTTNTNSQPPSVNWASIIPDVNDIVGGLFAGQIAHFAMNSAPDGWLIANGQAVSRSTFARLFSRIGTIYGAGNGSTTFNLPDLRGEFLRGLDNGRGVDAGRAIGSGQGGQIQSHDHFTVAGVLGSRQPLSALNTLRRQTNVAEGGLTNENFEYTLMGTANPATFGLSSSAGGNETRPRNVAMLACIKW